MKKHFYNTVIAGAGAAGWATALRLLMLGVKDVAVITDDKNGGVSLNSGSDKQTYYKLSLSGAPDSPHDMAADIFSGGCTDGDTALIESACSVRAFMLLTELGVGFPANRYGEYVGYITDHDKRGRATSAGPYTSRDMTLALREAALLRGAVLFDKTAAVRLIIKDGGCRGVLAVSNGEYSAFFAAHTVMATGGPGGIYADSVYPAGHTGSTGLFLQAGASLCNMTEWQYGLASLSPRWNVSGSYMQCLPRFVSCKDGVEYDFCTEYYEDAEKLYSATFQKGYQWPFNVRRLDGSSSLDLLVKKQTELGREVFLDFTKNAYGTFDVNLLTNECRNYLGAANALADTPVKRLRALNEPAYRFYLEHGIDLEKDKLKIGLCAQHCNGGASVDTDWQTDIHSLFAVGEAAGTHGVYRPGGCALNAGQVGALRAASYIAKSREKACEYDISSELSDAGKILSPHGNISAFEKLSYNAGQMSTYCAALRDIDEAKKMISDTEDFIKDFDKLFYAEKELDAYRLYDSLLTRLAVLQSVIDYAARGESRGSALYSACGGEDMTGMIQTVKYSGGKCKTENRPVRSIPKGGGFFEQVWREKLKG